MSKPSLNSIPSRLAVVAGVLCSLALAGCGVRPATQEAPGPVVLVASAAAAEAPEARATGLVVSRAAHVIASEVGGRVLRLNADVGDRVRRGQELAVLDPQPARLQLIQAEAELRRAEQLANERATAAARSKSLFDAGVTTRAELEDVQAQSAAARAAVVAVRAGLALAQRAERETRLRAPADGIIAARHAQLSQMLAPGAMVFELDGQGRRDIKVALPAGAVTERMQGAVMAYQYNGQTGQARFLGASARTLTSGAHEARLEIVSGDPAIGAPVDVLFVASQAARGAIVPIAAVLTRRSGARCVLKVGKDNTVSEVPVELLRLTSTGAVVFGAIDPGDRVVAAGGEFVRVGATVRPVLAQR